MSRAKYKIVNKFRFYTFVSMVMLLLVFSLLTVTVNAKGMDDVKLISICVESGDTLWNLSEQYSDKQNDIREYISLVMDLNHLDTSNIMPGQIINFPDYRNN